MANGGLKFSGQYGNAVASDSGLPAGAAPFSISLHYLSGAVENGPLVSWGILGTRAYVELRLLNGYLQFTNGTDTVADPTSTNNGQWHWAGCTYNGTTLSLYCDNPATPVGSATFTQATTLTGGAAGTGAGEFTVGHRDGEANYPNITFDKLYIYSVALDLTARTSLYNSGDGTDTPPTTGLIRSYSFDDGAGAPAASDSVGGFTLTLYGPNTPAWVTGVAPPVPVAEVDPASLWIPPDGMSLWMNLRRISDHAASNVQSYFSGATITVNGGTPIALANPSLRAGDSNRLIFSLVDAPHRVMIDDADAALTGAWTPTADATYGDRIVGNSYSRATGTAGTGAYSFTGLPAGGKFQLHRTRPTAATLAGLTTDAQYVVNDGASNVATYHVNQSAVATDDDLYNKFPLSKIGTPFTISGTTATITLSNAAGTGDLHADALCLIQVFDRVVPEKSTSPTVLFSATTGWAITADGLTAPETDLSCALHTWEEWFPVTTTPGPNRMRVGWNVLGPNPYDTNTVYANTAQKMLLWQGRNGSVIPDIDPITGDLLGVSGGGSEFAYLATGVGNGTTFDSRGYRMLPSGTYVFKHLDDAGYVPNPSLDVAGGTVGARSACPDETIDSHDGDGPQTYKVYKQDITFGDGEFNSQFSLKAFDRCRKVRISDPQVPEFARDGSTTWTKMAHPNLVARTIGGVAFRNLNTWPVNNAQFGTYADLPDRRRNIISFAGRVRSLDVIRVEPVNVTSSDADRAYDLFHGSPFVAYKVVCSSPHGMIGAPHLDLSGGIRDTGNVQLEMPVVGAGGLTTYPNAHSVCWVTSPTTFTTFTPDHPSPGIGLATITGPIDVENHLTFNPDQNCPSLRDLMQLAIDCGQPGIHLCLPHNMDAANAELVADEIIAYTSAGFVVDCEFSNEPWNTQPDYTGQANYFIREAIAAGYPGFNMEAYVVISKPVFDAMAAKFATAGRSADFKRVFNYNPNDGSSGTAILNALVTHSAPADWIAFAPYVGPNLGVASAIDRLTIEALVSTFRLCGEFDDIPSHVSGILAGIAAAQAAAPGLLDDLKPSTYEGGPQDACPGSTDGLLRVMRSHAASKNPHFFRAYLSFIQKLETLGVRRYTRYFLCQRSTPQVWSSYFNGVEAPGTGDVSENANPYDQFTTVSQMGGAERTFAGYYAVTEAPTPARRVLRIRLGNRTLTVGKS